MLAYTQICTCTATLQTHQRVLNSCCATVAGNINPTLLHLDADIPIPHISSINHNLFIEGMPMQDAANWMIKLHPPQIGIGFAKLKYKTAYSTSALV